jgi:peptidoglycan/xylan/chitin deacetylase (PgdA/CDA1 family)
MKNNSKFFLLTFDLEEFDAPREYNKEIKEKEMYENSYNGTIKIIESFDRLNIKATFFVTGNFALKYPKLIESIYKKGHEIASHSKSHSDNYEILKNTKKEIKEAKIILEKTIKDKVVGFRTPRLQKPPLAILNELGFKYDSSIHPTYIPSKYNNIKSSRKTYKEEGIYEIPISVTPLLRLPFSWIWFRNLGLNYGKIGTIMCIQNQAVINLYFHPWEFVDITEYNIPFLVKNKTGLWMEKNFEKYIKWCISKNLKFITINDYISLISKDY